MTPGRAAPIRQEERGHAPVSTHPEGQETAIMALGWKKTPKPDDPRLQGHETTYSSQRGGWVKTKPKPVPGTPKKG